MTNSLSIATKFSENFIALASIEVLVNLSVNLASPYIVGSTRILLNTYMYPSPTLVAV